MYEQYQKQKTAPCKTIPWTVASMVMVNCNNSVDSQKQHMNMHNWRNSDQTTHKHAKPKGKCTHLWTIKNTMKQAMKDMLDFKQSSVNSQQKQNMLINRQKTHKCSELCHNLSHNVVNIQQRTHKHSKL